MSDDHDALPLPVWRKRHGISKSTYYTLPQEDRPRLMRVGARDFVSREASIEWRRRMEAKHPGQVDDRAAG
jgi:hypothetical protein